ncbi:MAG: PAS domain-containing protein [Opitutaceae bacterium]|jgi:two-component system phosphate regulon sensor histidine kinase PhoR|nr:PAS domain-containing protein [Opitutaceae bacterium]
MSWALLALLALCGALAWVARRERRLRREETEHHARERAGQDARHATALRERSAHLEALFDHMIEGLIVVDAAGRIRLANRAAGAQFGFDAPVVGRPLLEVVRHHEVAAVVARLQHEREVLGHEFRLERVPPQIMEVNAVALPESAGALLVFHDLTKLRRLEMMRQDFVANVSHELRTPLSLIKGAAETLLDGGQDDPATREKFLGIIDRHASRLALLIEDLLLLSALDAGRIELRVQPVPLRVTVQEVLEDLAPAAQARGVALANEVPAALEARADAGRLRQVLANLIDNAIKYGREHGQVQVGATMLGAGWLQVFVRDDGPGIPAEARERVFERFFRVDRARARSQGGTGLGLAIVKNLVLAHGGDVRLESAEGRGTTFYLKLPAA